MRRVRARRKFHRLNSRFSNEPLLLEILEPRLLFSGSATPAQLVAQANNAFAFDLLHVLPPDSSGNTFFSPYSVSTALETVLQGAKGNTAAQIIQALHLPKAELADAGIQALYQLFQAGPSSAGYTLSTANQLWVNQNFSLLQSFLDGTEQLDDAAPQSVDFSDPTAAAAQINAWVNTQTHGKIPSLLTPDDISPLTQLIITNAIYFKGDWASPFNANATQSAFYQVSSSSYEMVQMMQQTNSFGYYAQTGANGFQAIDLPYAGNDLDMIVILPTTDSLDGFDSTLNADLFSQITSRLTSQDVDVQMPKFKINETYDLVDPLTELGIKDAFGNEADFSGIAGPGQPHQITGIGQTSSISVDETGTVAVAVTSIRVGMCAMVAGPQPIPISFDANHPFIFAIRDRATNTILFMGQETDPGGTPTTLTSGETGSAPIFMFTSLEPPQVVIPSRPISTELSTVKLHVVTIAYPAAEVIIPAMEVAPPLHLAAGTAYEAPAFSFSSVDTSQLDTSLNPWLIDALAT